MVSAGWHEGGTNRAARDATASRYASALANTSTAWRVAYRLMWVYIFTLAFFSDAVGAVGITFDALIRDAGVSKVRVLLSDVLFDRKELINSVFAIVCAVHKLAKVAIWAIISASIGRRGQQEVAWASCGPPSQAAYCKSCKTLPSMPHGCGMLGPRPGRP